MIMPTLLQLNCTSNWGSAGKIEEQIGQKTIEAGWECYVAFGRYSNPSVLNTTKVGNMFWTLEHYVENRLLDNEGLASRIPTKRFLKEVDKIRPDIVHLHIIHDHWINYRMLFNYLAEKRIPVVWTQHDQWATTGHCCYNLMGCERWKTECHDCPLSKWYSLDMSRRNFNLKKNLCAGLKSLTIVPVSEWLADNMRQSHLKDRPIEVIHNGIDINVFRPQAMDVHKRYGIEEGKKIVLGVAAVWDARKGLTDFYQLAKRLPADEFAIVIVGKLTKEKQTVEGGCQMVFVDRTQNALELAQLYSAASAFANPTYQDNYPTTNLEAMACGTPVITYNTGGSPEAVDENTGAVVAQGDVETLATAIEKFSAMDCKEACLKRAEALFDDKKCFNAYISLYNNLLWGGKFVILGVASVWSKDKGLYDFIELSKNPDFIVLLVGLKQEQVDMFNSPEYKDCNMVPVCRTQNQQELAMLYSIADVFVNPTYADMFPTVNLEALACGTPVITYKTGGSPEAVGGKTSNNSGKTIEMFETGAVVENGNLEALAATIREFCDTDFKKKHSADCRKRAEECFDKDKCFEKYVELYESLLKL